MAYKMRPTDPGKGKKLVSIQDHKPKVDKSKLTSIKDVNPKKDKNSLSPIKDHKVKVNKNRLVPIKDVNPNRSTTGRKLKKK